MAPESGCVHPLSARRGPLAERAKGPSGAREETARILSERGPPSFFCRFSKAHRVWSSMMRHPTALLSEDIDIRGLLHRSMVFRDLGPADLADLEPWVEIHAFSKGAFIFPPAEPCTALLLVADGLVKVSICSSSGRQITYLLAEEGEPVNLVGPFTGLPRLLAHRPFPRPEWPPSPGTIPCLRLRTPHDHSEHHEHSGTGH